MSAGHLLARLHSPGSPRLLALVRIAVCVHAASVLMSPALDAIFLVPAHVMPWAESVLPLGLEKLATAHVGLLARVGFVAALAPAFDYTNTRWPFVLGAWFTIATELGAASLVLTTRYRWLVLPAILLMHLSVLMFGIPGFLQSACIAMTVFVQGGLAKTERRRHPECRSWWHAGCCCPLHEQNQAQHDTGDGLLRRNPRLLGHRVRRERTGI